MAPNGSGRQRYIADGPARFFARRDRAAWLAAGCPTLTIPPTEGTYPAGGYPAGNQLDSSGLPAEPRALLAAIVKRFEGGKLHVAQTFEIVGTLLQDSGSPVLRAALYRMVAQLPGVRLLGDRVDALGRHGVAVGVSVGVGADGVRDELLFDPASSDVLQWDQVQARPDTATARPGARMWLAPVGAVLHYFAYLDRGVVNSIEQLPGGGKVPFHAACADAQVHAPNLPGIERALQSGRGPVEMEVFPAPET